MKNKKLKEHNIKNKDVKCKKRRAMKENQT
jgi:hypothetical protein